MKSNNMNSKPTQQPAVRKLIPSARMIRPYGTYYFRAVIRNHADKIIWEGDDHHTEEQALEESKAELVHNAQLYAYLEGRADHPM